MTFTKTEQLANKTKQLANKGDAKAQYKLGEWYCKGEGVARDDAKAVYWYAKAAKQGHVEATYQLQGIFESMEELIEVLTGGKGVKRDMDIIEDEQRLTKAAEQANPVALAMLGEISGSHDE